MSMYDIPVDYDGRTVVLRSDPDRIIFLNCDNIVWPDGTPLTVQECIDYLKYYGRHGFTPVNKALVYKDVCFMDAQSEYFHGYGLVIDFDENGNPKCKVEDGRILSSRIPCICESDYQNILLDTRGKYDAFCGDLVSSGAFTYIGKQVGINNSKFSIYKCNKCGTSWLFPLWDERCRMYPMLSKEGHDKYMARQKALAKESAKPIFLYIVLIILAIIITGAIFVQIAVKFGLV